jgi:DNA-binding response OmpR family regulator
VATYTPGDTSRAGAVLIVDGDVPAACRLAERLRGLGQVVHTARSGTDAVRIAESAPLALAIVDVVLADMSGYQLATHLRATHPRLSLMMTTADPRPELEVEARRVGIVHYAHKPLEADRVTAILRAAGGGVIGGPDPPGRAAPGPGEGERRLSPEACAAGAATARPWREAPRPR